MCVSSGQRGRPIARRAAAVPTEYEAAARALDHAHSLVRLGEHYPAAREQVRLGLVGPVLRALRALAPPGGECCVGLVAGSFQGASDSVEALVGVAAQAQATAAWRLMGARDQPEAVGIFTHRVRRRWGAVFWRT